MLVPVYCEAESHGPVWKLRPVGVDDERGCGGGSKPFEEVTSGFGFVCSLKRAGFCVGVAARQERRAMALREELVGAL